MSMMRLGSGVASCLLLAVVLCPIAYGQTPRGATFGTVIPIGGHIADIALDEPRGRLYVANFTANRIEVINTGNNSLQAPILVSLQPITIALSPNGRYLVIGHYGTYFTDNFLPVPPPFITIYDLEARTERKIPRDPSPPDLPAPQPLPPSPLAIAFGKDGKALVVSNRQPDPSKPRFGPSFELLDPTTGSLTPLEAVPLDSEPLPVPLATFPPEIGEAAATASGDGDYIYFQAKALPIDPDITHFSGRYHVSSGSLVVGGGTSVPEPGPMVISVNHDGSIVLSDWTLSNRNFVLLAQFPYPIGRFNVGSHAFDSSRHLIYAHVPTENEISPQPSTVPAGDGAVLTILDSDNLTVRERIRLPESLAGRSILTSSMQTMYSISDSGVTVLPIGSLEQTHRIAPLQEDLFFPSSASSPSPLVGELDVVNPGGGATDFSLSASALGVRIVPESGVTPARVRVEVDPALFLPDTGTTTVTLNIRSSAAINIPFPVRLLVNTRDADQVGTIVHVPGKLVDILPDPARDRFYVLRQDRNLVLVFDGTSFAQIAMLRTGNTPTQMALTRDARFLIVGNDNSQIANVYDLDLLQPSQFIRFPGHYPRSIAVSNSRILAASRWAVICLKAPLEAEEDIRHCISEIDFAGRTATRLPSLGIYRNNSSPETVLAASPSGESIFIAMPDGTVVLYEATPANTFVASRHDLPAISGAYAALTDRLFVADNNVLNWSLLPITQLENGTGSSSGMTFSEGFALRTTSPSPSAPGVIQRVNLVTFQGAQRVRMAESPLLVASLPTPSIGQIGQTILPFLRTIAPLSNRTSIVALTISGFTVLPWNFEGVPPGPGPGPGPEPGPVPSVDRVVNLADEADGIAPGGLVSISGSNFSNTVASAGGFPLPTTLTDVSVTVGNRPLALLTVSPNRIEAQLPFSVAGAASLQVVNRAGTSSPFPVTIFAGAPAVFRTATAGPMTGLPTLYRVTNNEVVTLTNPIHPRDTITVFLTGLGVTSPAVENGVAAPSDPLANALLEPFVSLAEEPLAVLFAGLVPGLAGVYQINAVVPDTVPEGLELPLIIEQGSYATTLQVRVVR